MSDVSFADRMTEVVVPAVAKFTGLRPVMALRSGLLVIMPLTIIGSVFLLLANFPIAAVMNWFADVGLTPWFNQIFAATFNMIGLVGAISITYHYVKEAGYEAIVPAAVTACAYVLFLNFWVTAPESGEVVKDVIPMMWTGSRGLILAIIVGEIAGAIYVWFLNRNIVIKMPDGVPPAVANSFTALLPGFAILTLSMIVWGILQNFDTTLPEMVYDAIQKPLQGISDTLGGALVMAFMISFLWWFGVHGSSLVGGIMQPLLTPNSQENQAILDAGKELTVENGGHIVTQQFLDQAITMTGSGITLGIVIYMLFMARSSQYKTLGRLSGAPAIFNINEPVIFGVPIVLNLFMFIPFLMVPVFCVLIQYFCLATGLVPLYTGVLAPWTTPPIISGFIVGGPRTAIMQAVILLMSFIVYLPFIRRMDKMAKADEDGAHAEHLAAEAAAAEEAELRAKEHAEYVEHHPEAKQG